MNTSLSLLAASRRRARAFSLVEMMVVLSVVSLLAALLFPAFSAVRGKARQISCASNLHQICLGISIYMQDYDGFFPYAIAPDSRVSPERWASHMPKFAADIPHIGLLQDVMHPYLRSKQVFQCPSDIGFDFLELNKVSMDAFPSSYEKYGTSYYYRTSLAACGINEANSGASATSWMLVDGAAYWHGTLVPLEKRSNVLFLDGHTKNMTDPQFEAIRGTRLNTLPLPFTGCV